jgi:hypothetical protein
MLSYGMSFETEMVFLVISLIALAIFVAWYARQS